MKAVPIFVNHLAKFFHFPNCLGLVVSVYFAENFFSYSAFKRKNKLNVTVALYLFFKSSKNLIIVR